MDGLGNSYLFPSSTLNLSQPHNNCEQTPVSKDRIQFIFVMNWREESIHIDSEQNMEFHLV